MAASTRSPLAQRWADDLAAWAIPEHILAQATADPWKLTPGMFPPAELGAPADTAARRAALEALPASGGTVLDVGAGPGAAGLALSPPAAHLVAVDESGDMLAALSERAGARGVEHRVVHGRWPDVAASVGVADVVVCHHVLYNVADLVPFVDALTAHARRRVVVAITGEHPVKRTNPLWERFWGVARPEGPTADDLLAVLAEAGIAPDVAREREPWARPARAEVERVASVTRRLCLPPERQDEVGAALAELAELGELADREVVTMWWTGSAGAGA